MSKESSEEAKSVSLLQREFLLWIASSPRTYEQTMEAWRTSCPRHAVWEDALIDELIQMEPGSAADSPHVTLTPRGRAILHGQ